MFLFNSGGLGWAGLELGGNSPTGFASMLIRFALGWIGLGLGSIPWLVVEHECSSLNWYGLDWNWG